MTVAELYNQAVKQITAARIPDPDLEASLLLGHVLNKTRVELLLAGSQTLSSKEINTFQQYLDRRLQRIPLAYILGEQEFWSKTFKVNHHVLIPRPETEQLIDIVLRTVKVPKSRQLRIVDFGTGSGVIAAVLALELANSLVVAVDRSFSALQVARHNFQKHHISSRIHPLCASWGSALKFRKWDLVVANPPYIAHDAMASLQHEVQNEPVSALDGGVCGMEDINVIAGQLDELLQDDGWFFMEIGFDQRQLVLDLFNSMSGFADVAVHEDYAGLPRVLQARKNGLNK